MAKTVSPRLSQTRWSSGTDEIARTDFDTDAANLDANVMLFKEGTLANRPTAGLTGRVYTVKGDASNLNGRQYYDNGLTWTADKYGADSLIEATAAGTTALTVKAGSATPTVDIFAVTDVNLAPLVRVTPDGVLSTQSTVGSSGGAYLGSTAAHSAAGQFTSVAAAKPVLVAKGATNQTAPVLLVQDSSAATLASVAANGNALFSGSVTGNSLISSTSVTTNTLAVNTSGAITNLSVSPGSIGVAGLVVNSTPSHASNLAEFKDSSGTRVARVGRDGVFATATRVIVGSIYGDSTSIFSDTTASLYVRGDASQNAAIARFVANATQTGQLLQVADSTNSTKFWVDNVGNLANNGNTNSQTASIGPNNPSPTALFGGYAPVLEVVTGTSTGAFSDEVIVRHSGASTTAATRRTGISFKLGTEASAVESNKSAGIHVLSTSASGTNPNLLFMVGGAEQARLDAVGNFTVQNQLVAGSTDATVPNISMGSSLGTKISFFASTPYELGIQSNTMFFRSGKRYSWFVGGAYNGSENNPGAGGDTAMTLTGGTDNRLSVGRLTLTDTTANDASTPAFLLGSPSGIHMQFSNQSMNTFTSATNATNSTLNLQNGGTGGVLNLGSSDTSVRLPSRTMYVGTNRFYFGSSTWAGIGGSPNDNDWWFDHTNQQIKVRNGSSWTVIAKA